jgi:hypothetical protein
MNTFYLVVRPLNPRVEAIFIFNTHTCTWADNIVPFDRENLRTLNRSVRPVWPIQLYCEIHKAHINKPCGKNAEIFY